MNKIKLMYDVARAMRDEDSINGTVKLSLMKEGVETLQMDSEFSRNFKNGWGQAKISSAIDHEGKQLRHESSTEFNINKEQDNEPPGCKKHRLFHRHGCGMHGDIKKRLDHIMAVLNALNHMQVLEQEDKSICVSLDLNEIPKELQEAFRSRMMHRHHTRSGIMSGCPVMEKGSLECRISQNYKLENITVKWQGKLQEENQTSGDINLDIAAAFTR